MLGPFHRPGYSFVGPVWDGGVVGGKGFFTKLTLKTLINDTLDYFTRDGENHGLEESICSTVRSLRRSTGSLTRRTGRGTRRMDDRMTKGMNRGIRRIGKGVRRTTGGWGGDGFFFKIWGGALAFTPGWGRVL